MRIDIVTYQDARHLQKLKAAFPLRGLTMGHLKTESGYRFYQDLIRELMAELGSPALYFEYYAWNLGKKQ